MSPLISYREAVAQITRSVAPRADLQRLGLLDARGRILGVDIRAPIDSPSFTNSAMDGFAVLATDFHDGRTFEVIGTQLAGALPNQSPYAPGCCLEIMTGAPLPAWADAVVPVERSEACGDNRVKLSGELSSFDNVRRQGEDLRCNDLLLAKGARLDPERQMILANFGLAYVDVVAPLNCLLISTGDELLPPGEAPRAGAVYNSSRVYLESAARELHLNVLNVVTLPDDEALLIDLLQPHLEAKDDLLVVSTGAVSAGVKDFIPSVAAKLGFETLFHKVAIRPGKPLFFAAKGKIRWLGLPGNPISTAIGWTFFVRPLLQAWCGTPLPRAQLVSLATPVRKPKDLRAFFRASIDSHGKAKVHLAQGSAHFAASIGANAYVSLPEGTEYLEPETKVEAVWL